MTTEQLNKRRADIYEREEKDATRFVATVAVGVTLAWGWFLFKWVM